MAWNLDGVSAFLRGRRKRAKHHPVYETTTANPGELRVVGQWECPLCDFVCGGQDGAWVAAEVAAHQRSHG